VTVVNHNDAPVLGPLTDDVATAGATYTKTLTATDPDGDVLTFTLLSGPAGMTLAGSQLSWTPTLAQRGSWPVSVRVTDSAGLGASGQFHVAVPFIDAVDDHYSVILGQTLGVAAPGVLANDTDPAGGGPLAAQNPTTPDKGALTAFHADGSFTYQAPAVLPGPAFAPAVKVHVDALGSFFADAPLVVDVDGDGKPEMILHGGFGFTALRGSDGSVLWNTPAFPANSPASDCSLGLLTGGASFHVAVGDVDDSGQLSIVFPTSCGFDVSSGFVGTVAARYAALNARDGSFKWLSPPLGNAREAGFPAAWAAGTVPTIARVRAGETPSILVGTDGSYFLFNGKPYCDEFVPGWPALQACRAVFILDGKDGSVRQRMFAPSPLGGSTDFGSFGNGYQAAVAADLDGDGKVEILFGGSIFNNDGSVRYNQNDPSGFTARPVSYWVGLGNFDDTPDIEVARIEDSAFGHYLRLAVYKSDGRLLWALPLSSAASLGVPVVADVDGTGRPAVVFNIDSSICAVDYRGQYKWCHDAGTTAGVPNIPVGIRVQVYDLEGSGVPEVIVPLNPETLLFLDGKTGNVKATLDMGAANGTGGFSRSGDGTGGPVIADLDGSGHAAILTLWDAPTRIDVVGSQNNDWRPARKIFHQESYQWGNVNEDGTVPQAFVNNFATPATNVFGTQAQTLPPVDPRKATQTTFTYQASEGAMTSAPATVTIELLPLNRPPVFVSEPPTRCVTNAPFAYTALAIDPDPGDTVTYSIKSAPFESSNCVIGAASGVLTCDNLFLGDQAFVLAATDNHGAVGYQTIDMQPSTGPAPVPNVVGQLQAAAGATLTAAGFATGDVTPIDNAAPAGQVIQQDPAAGTPALLGSVVDLVVSNGPAQPPLVGPPPQLGNIARILVAPATSLRLVGETLPYTATAVNTDGTGEDVTALAAWTSSSPGVATVDAAGNAHGVAPGTTLLTANVGGLSGQATLAIAARLTGDNTVPTAIITEPASGGTVTGLTQIVGTAASPHFLRYELALEASGDTAFTLIGQGTAAVTAGVLGTLDPTLLLNGAYLLQLTVFGTNGESATAQVPIVADGAQKIGNFTLAHVDLAVPLAGIPIQLTRLYDSRDKHTRDFGFGWSLGMKGALQVSESGVLGSDWQVVEQGTTFGLVPGSDHFVSVTLQSGRVDTFELQLTPTASFLVPFLNLQASFIARPGTLGSLASLDNTNILITDPQPGPVTLLDDSTQLTWNPDRFLYTQTDGTQVVVSRTHGIESVTDTNGNQITIGAGGITHSSGTSIVFTRDGGGRVTGITDPKGQSQSYVYSPAGDLTSHTDAAGRTTRYFYNAQHGLVRMEDPLGGATRTVYDDNGRVLSTTDAAGRTTTYNPDLPGRQEQVTDAAGRITLLNYDASGNVLAKTDPLGHTTTYTYDGSNNLLTQTDPLGRTASKTYDGQGNVLSSSDFDGNTTVLTYDAVGHVLTSIDPEGRTTTNLYDARGNLTQVTDPEGGIAKHTYDGSGNRLSTMDPVGNVSTFNYNAAGNMTGKTDPLGKVTTFAYDASGNETSGTDAAGKTTALVYDAANRITALTDSGGNVFSIGYSDQGDGQKIATRTDPFGKVTKLGYDSVGNLITTTFVDGVVQSKTYDANDRLITTTDGNGFTTTFNYDALGRLTSTVYPDGAAASKTYDAAGRVLTETDERGNTTTLGYAPNQQTITDALGRATVLEFDSQGRRVQLTDALGRITRFAYDSAGNLVKTTFPDGSFKATTYDAAKRKTAEIDQAGRSTQFGYDAAGHPLHVTNAAGGVTSYTYDAVGNRLTATDADGHTTTMSYDALGRMVGRVRPSGVQETFTYDANNNQLSHTDFNGQTTAFTYDAAGRLTQKNVPGSGTVSYAYGATGLRTQAGGDSYSYDQRGRLIEEYKASGQKLLYTNDPAGNISSVTTPQGTTTYTHDALNRLATVVDAAGTTSYSYDVVGNLASTAYPNGVTEVYGYDTLNRLVQVSNSGPGGLISSYAYTLGPSGNRLQVVESGPATTGRTVAYTFDAVFRLTQEHIAQPAKPDVTLGYSYDPAGNRTQMNRAGAVTTYTYDADDRLITAASVAGSVTSTYDNNGNLKTANDGSNTASYGYDAENRLLTAVEPSGTISYTYDADGMRASKTAGGLTTTFLVDKVGAGTSCRCKNGERALPQVLVETTGINAVTYSYGNALIDQAQPGFGTHFYLTDGQLSVRQLTDAAGAVTDAYDFDAFGVALASTGSTPNVYLYTGQQFDPNLGFYYLRARYYDAVAGRFVTTDSAAGDIYDPVSLHRYLYANGNPVDNWDPTGREEWSLANVSFTNTMIAALSVGLVTFGISMKQTAGDWATSLGYAALNTTAVIVVICAFVPSAALAVTEVGLNLLGGSIWIRFLALLHAVQALTLAESGGPAPSPTGTISLAESAVGTAAGRIANMVSKIKSRAARCLALKALQFQSTMFFEIAIRAGRLILPSTRDSFGSQTNPEQEISGAGHLERMRGAISGGFTVNILKDCGQ
jgi:RHS repeat-associated protein